MHMEGIGGFILFIFLVASSIILRKSKKSRKKQPPGPWPLPIVGNLHQLDRATPHRSLLALSRRYGPLMFLRLGAIPTLVISSSRVAEEFFRRHDLAISGRPFLVASRKLMYNHSSITFSTYGEYWRQARKICTMEMLNPRRIRALATVREREVAKVVAGISATDKKLSTSSSSVNFSELAVSLTNNIICGAAFGATHGVGRDGHDLHEVLLETQRLLVGFCVEDYFPGMAWVDRLIGFHARMEKNFEELDKVVCQYMKKGEMEDNSDGEENLLQVLLRLHKTADSSRRGFLNHIDHVKGLIVDIFLAGTDTASITIIWAMTELMRNPTVMRKLQQELQLMFGSKCKLIEETELDKLEYLKLVVKETLRLHAPGPLLVPRETTEPCTIQGFQIPVKTRIIINANAIATDPNVWKKPLEFWPERFLDTRIDFRGQDFEYIPFGAGRRICPGINFGTAVIELALANLLHYFDWTLPNAMKAEDIDMGETTGVGVQKKVPLMLVAKPKW